jgi:hypothetical protein
LIWSVVTLAGFSRGELPVQQSIKIKLILNRTTAKTLGLAAPITLPGRADEGHRITVAFVAVYEFWNWHIVSFRCCAPIPFGPKRTLSCILWDTP